MDEILAAGPLELAIEEKTGKPSLDVLGIILAHKAVLGLREHEAHGDVEMDPYKKQSTPFKQRNLLEWGAFSVFLAKCWPRRSGACWFSFDIDCDNSIPLHHWGQSRKNY